MVIVHSHSCYSIKKCLAHGEVEVDWVRLYIK